MKKFATCIAVVTLFIVCLCSVACAPKPTTYTFVCPDGAPALAAYSVMNEEGVDFTVYDSTLAVEAISADMAGGRADFAVLPFNLATKTAKHGYKMVGVLTHGNLYGVSKEQINSLADLKGKKVGVIQLNAVPGFTVRLMLEKAEIEYTQNISELDSETVFLRAIEAKPDVVKSLLDYQADAKEENKLDVCIVAEPMCNMIINKFGFSRSIDVQAEYGNFPQAVLMVKNSVLQNDRQTVDRIVNKMKSFDVTTINAQNAVDTISANMFNAQGGAKSSLNAAALTPIALQKSNTYFVGDDEYKSTVLAYANALKAFDTAIGSVVEEIDDSFFYLG